jgi:hypothetical protein
MPHEVEIDGEKKTVYLEDEFKAKSEEATKLQESITKLNEELGLGEGETLEEKIKDLKENQNQDIRGLRTAYKNAVSALKGKGVEIDEKTGQVKANAQGLSAEEIGKMIEDKISQGISSATLKINKDGALSGFSEEERKKIEPVFDKLMAIGGSVEENLSLAEAKVFPDRAGNPIKRVYNSAVGGGAHVSVDGSKDDFSQSNQGKGLGEMMGLSSFKKKANK